MRGRCGAAAGPGEGRLQVQVLGGCVAFVCTCEEGAESKEEAGEDCIDVHTCVICYLTCLILHFLVDPAISTRSTRRATLRNQ